MIALLAARLPASTGVRETGALDYIGEYPVVDATTDLGTDRWCSTTRSGLEKG